MSFDGNHLAISGDANNDFIYTISSGAMSPVVNVTSHVANPDSTDMTPGNNVAITGLDGVYYYDNQMNFIRKDVLYGGHSDRAKDTDGSDVTVITNSNDSSGSLPTCPNGIVKVNLAKGTQQCLQTLDWSLAVHISCNNFDQKWCEADPYDPSHAGAWEPFTDEILMVRLDGTQTVRLAHTRSSNSTYNTQPRAAISQDGKYVAFDSNMAGSTDVYLLILPTSLENLNPTPTPTALPNPTPVFLKGDINQDGVVNIQDYTLLSNAFGTSNAAADLNSDGVVNIQDYVILSNNFGK